MTIEVEGFSEGEDEERPLGYLLRSDHDKPPDKVVSCRICRQPLKVTHYWLLNRWLRPTVHEKCRDRWELEHYGGKVVSVEIPDRFRHWDSTLFKNQRAIAEALEFGPDSRYKTLAILGDAGRGKSRLMWQVVKAFFDLWRSDRGQQRWIEYFLASDLLSEYDQSQLKKLKAAQFAFVDDLRDFPPGRVKAALQEVVRFRVQAQRWTFLTIDSEGFDKDLVQHVLTGRAHKVIV